ncbi:MAG: hypothetical protein IPL86_12960 [Flavobacteriales bacterium]|nr:hypothetical protein [Flavobacteriales bacterium]
MAKGMPLYLPVAWLLAVNPWIAIATSMALVTLVGHRMDRTGNDSEVFERRNHLSSMLLPLLLALLPHGLAPGPALVGALPMLFAISKPWTTMNRAEAPGKLFDAGLLLGLAALFYLPYAFLVVVVWATIAVTRPFHWREYVLPAVGGAAVLFIGWGVAKLAFPGVWNPVASFHFGDNAPLHVQHWMYRVILLGILAVLAVTVLFTFQSVYARSIIRVQNIRASFLAFAFAMGLLALFAWWLDRRIPPALLAGAGVHVPSLPPTARQAHRLGGCRVVELVPAGALGAVWAVGISRAHAAFQPRAGVSKNLFCSLFAELKKLFLSLPR